MASGGSRLGGIAGTVHKKAGVWPSYTLAGQVRGGELVSVNAAMIIAYGMGALIGPALGGAAMERRDPQGLMWLFVALFAGLLVGTRTPARARR